MKPLFSGILRDSFSRSVLTLMTGTLIAQAIPVAISPVLTRLFSPENFGLFALYFSISQILSVFITGRYEYAIILPEKDRDALNIVALCLAITIGVTLLCMLLMWPLRFFIAGIVRKPELAGCLWLMPLTMLSIGVYTTFNLWFNRMARFRDISAGKILRSTLTGVFSLGFGLTVIRSAGLIIADTTGQLGSSIYLVRRFVKTKDFRLKETLSLSSVRQQASTYSQFPKFNILSGLLEKGSGQVPVLLLSSFFGSAVTGFFSLSQRVIAVPEALISVSVGDVFRQQASVEYQQTGTCRKTFLNLLRLLIMISVVPFIMLGLFAPWLFSFIFGEEWRVAGEYARILSVMFFLSFIVSPLSNMFIIAQKQKIDLVLQIFLFLFICLSFFMGRELFASPAAALTLYAATYCIKYFVELYLSYRFSLGPGSNKERRSDI